MDPLNLLYLTYLAKFSGQISIIIISLNDPSSPTIKYIAVITSILSGGPLFHIIVHLLCKTSLNQVCFIGYIVVICIAPDILWFTAVHVHSLKTYIIVILSDIASTCLFIMSRYRRSTNEPNVEIGEQSRPDIEGGNDSRYSRGSNERGYRRTSPRTMPREENSDAIAADNRPPVIHSQPYDIPHLDNRETRVFRRGPARVIEGFPFHGIDDIYTTHPSRNGYPRTEIDDDNESQVEDTDPVPPTDLHPALREPRASPSNFPTSGRISGPQELPDIGPSSSL
ncbi:hypothetical protein F5884DRAFT_890455 [Xylogone sp. PMI_703]|nr:hypothetical protein F5884DRAFT_890455 [Xylogone sp. PMI_703]